HPQPLLWRCAGRRLVPAAIPSALAQLGLSTDFRAAYFVVVAVLLAWALWQSPSSSCGASGTAGWRCSSSSSVLLTLGIWPRGVRAALVISHPNWLPPLQPDAILMDSQMPVRQWHRSDAPDPAQQPAQSYPDRDDV